MVTKTKTSLENLNWEVKESPIFDATGNALPGYKSISRSDNGELLSIAKQTYTPTLNEKFIESAHILADRTGFELQGFDEFQGGKKVMAFLKNPDLNKDLGTPVQDYLMLGNSHDYSSSFFIGNTTHMLRCANQFTRQNKQYSVGHFKNHDAKIDELLALFDSYTQQNKKLYKSFQDFSKVKIDQNIIDASIERVLRIENSEEISTRKANIKNDVMASIVRETEDLGKNLLGLFNGFTHYTSHVRKTKEKTFGNSMGAMSYINDKAFNFCSELAYA